MSTGDYKVADISLADFGRKEIEIAEIEVSWLRILDLCGVLCVFDYVADVTVVPAVSVVDLVVNDDDQQPRL